MTDDPKRPPKTTTRFILYDLDPVFWSRVQDKATRDGSSVKDVIVKLLKAWLSVVVLALLTSPLHAQSLGDAAAAAAKNRPKAVKVYTDKDLKAEPAPEPASAPSTPATAGTPAVAPSHPPTETARADSYRDEAKKDEAYWKARMQRLTAAVTADDLRLATLTIRVNSLSADFDNSTSVSQRMVIRREREQVATEVARTQADLLTDRTAVVTAEEEARRAAVPAGWLRP